MNKPLRHVVVVLLCCFTLLFVQLNRIQILNAEPLASRPENNRSLQRDFNRPRGSILTSDGVVVAESVPTPGGVFDEQRTYPQNELYSHTVGYNSFTFGATGVERTYNDELIGRTDEQEAIELGGLLSGEDTYGDVILTLDHGMQTLARDLLGERRGSVVALDPVTGAVYAMWSYPAFDPNSLAVNDGSLANEAWTELVNADGNPLLAKAFREIYPPGSTFKVVTSSAALESNLVTLTSPEFPDATTYVPPLTERALGNFEGSTCGGNLIELLVVSCNTAFAQLAAEDIGPNAMIRQAEQYGFNSEIPIDLPLAVASKFPSDFGSEVRSPTDDIPAGVFEGTPILAQTAIGQNDVAATPLQMALVAAAVSNNGRVPTPYVVAEILNHNTGSRLEQFSPGAWRQATSSDTALDLTPAMIEVTKSGSAQGVRVDDIIVGAKTGTAQVGTDPPRSHAWIIVFAGRPEGAPELAIAVLVEGQNGNSEQTGGLVAAPIAKGLIEEFFKVNSPDG